MQEYANTWMEMNERTSAYWAAVSPMHSAHCTGLPAEGVSEDWDTGSKPTTKPGYGNREHCFLLTCQQYRRGEQRL